MITPLTCSLAGQHEKVQILPGTRARALYSSTAAMEDFYCNYGVNPDFRQRLEESGLIVSGTGPSGEIRIVELETHPFFMPTLFLPQTRSTAASPHPLLAGFAAAVNRHWQNHRRVGAFAQ